MSSIEQKALTVVEQAKSLTVTNDQEYEAAAIFLRDIVKSMRHEIDAVFDPVIKSAHDAHKSAIKAKKGVEEPLVQAEATLKSALGLFALERAKRAAAGEALPAPKVSGVSTRETWTFEIVDEAKIERTFLMPDTAKIGAVVRSLHEAAEEVVGGIRVRVEVGVASR